MNIFGKLLLAAALLSFTYNCARADDAPCRLEVFYVPLFDPALNGPNPQVPNRFANCLPGKLYDVRDIFGQGSLGREEFIFFNPESKMLVAYATNDNLDLTQAIADVSRPLPHVEMEGAISIGADADGKNPAARNASLRVEGQTAVKCSSADDHGISYDFEAEPMQADDGYSIYVRLNCKVTYREVKYALNPGTNIATGKEHTIKLGKTPDGKDITLHITATVHPVKVVSPFANPDKKKKLLEGIEKHLAEQQEAMESGKAK